MLQRIFLYIVDQALFRMFLTITEHYVNEISRPNDCRVEKVQIEVLHILRNRKYIFLSCIKMSPSYCKLLDLIVYTVRYSQNLYCQCLLSEAA